MAYGMPAAEFLAICLITADYDMNASALDVVRRVEEYQEHSGLQFGESSGDFRGAFYDLLWKRAPQEVWHQDDFEGVLARLYLKDCADMILSFDNVWFNDEGESWSESTEDADWPEQKRRLVSWKDPDGNYHGRYIREHLSDRFTIKASLRFNRRMRELFEDGVPTRHELASFFGRSMYGRAILIYWARNGL